MAGLIAGNVANKSANANNLNQQAGSVQNSKNAYANAEKQMASLISSNPAPTAGQTIAAPTGNYGTPSLASHVLGTQPQQGQPATAQPAAAAPSPTMPANKTAQPVARANPSTNPAAGMTQARLMQRLQNGTNNGAGNPISAASPTSLARVILMSTAA